MARDDEWSAKWCCERIIQHDNISHAEPISGNSIRLSIKDIARPVFIATMSADTVKLEFVPEEFHDTKTEFLLNIPKDAYFDGELLTAAAKIPVGIGGIGDLYTAVNSKELRNYVDTEADFILRILGQHTSVTDVFRLNNRTYHIFRRSDKPPVKVLALNDYELTSDVVRSGIDRFGLPDFILASNPNRRISPTAKEAAGNAGTAVLTLRQLLGALNN